MSLVLELAKVRKSNGGQPTLKGLNLKIKRGEFVGLLGPNGVGKTTLFRVVTGLDRSESGTVKVFGLGHEQNGIEIRQRLGLVFQGRSIDLDMTVRENLRFHARLHGLTGKDLRLRVERCCVWLGIEGLQDRLARSLSGGQQRRVEIARALLSDPEFLILDEPTSGLDIESRQALSERIMTLQKEQGLSVLWATHHPEEIEAADMIAVLFGGRVVAAGSVNDLSKMTETNSIKEAYLALIGTPSA